MSINKRWRLRLSHGASKHVAWGKYVCEQCNRYFKKHNDPSNGVTLQLGSNVASAKQSTVWRNEGFFLYSLSMQLCTFFQRYLLILHMTLSGDLHEIFFYRTTSLEKSSTKVTKIDYQ